MKLQWTICCPYGQQPVSLLPNNPSNNIIVSSFYDDPKDDTFGVVMELLNELDETDKVRPE